MDAEELEGVATVAIDEFALEFANAGELERDVSGVGEDGEDGDDEAEVEAAGGGVLRGRRGWHGEKDITWARGRERRRRGFGERLEDTCSKAPASGGGRYKGGAQRGGGTLFARWDAGSVSPLRGLIVFFGE